MKLFKKENKCNTINYAEVVSNLEKLKKSNKKYAKDLDIAIAVFREATEVEEEQC